MIFKTFSNFIYAEYTLSFELSIWDFTKNRSIVCFALWFCFEWQADRLRKANENKADYTTLHIKGFF
jgi:hypothetical protein